MRVLGWSDPRSMTATGAGVAAAGRRASPVPSAGAHSSAAPAERAFRFGILSDVQAGDLPDGASFHGTPRYYREALRMLERAVQHFEASGVDLVIHLGDIVDYHNTMAPRADSPPHCPSERALRAVLSRFDALPVPALHMLGNHCLYNAPRHVLNERLGIDALLGRTTGGRQPAGGAGGTAAASSAAPQGSWHDEDEEEGHVGQHSYYSYAPAPGWRIVVLDGYDVSLLGWPPGHPLHELARATLEANNPNEDKNSAKGLEGVARRFVKFGGGLGAGQLAWLRGQLGACRAAGEQAIVCCHLAFHPDTAAPACLMWNYDAVLELLGSFPDVVAATFSGHAHSDGYARDAAGIHHRVCAAVVETPPGRDCFGVVDVYGDRILVQGVDNFASGDWELSRGGAGPRGGAAAKAGSGAALADPELAAAQC